MKRLSSKNISSIECDLEVAMVESFFQLFLYWRISVLTSIFDR